MNNNESSIYSISNKEVKYTINVYSDIYCNTKRPDEKNDVASYFCKVETGSGKYIEYYGYIPNTNNVDAFPIMITEVNKKIVDHFIPHFFKSEKNSNFVIKYFFTYPLAFRSINGNNFEYINKLLPENVSCIGILLSTPKLYSDKYKNFMNKDRVTFDVDNSPITELYLIKTKAQYLLDELNSYNSKKEWVDVIFIDFEVHNRFASEYKNDDKYVNINSCDVREVYASKYRFNLKTLDYELIDEYNRYYYSKHESKSNRNKFIKTLRYKSDHKGNYKGLYIEDLNSLKRFCEGCDHVVSHNVSYDSSMIPYTFLNNFCTCNKSKSMFGSKKKLTEFANLLNIRYNKDDVHKAKNDAEICFKIFSQLFKSKIHVDIFKFLES